jgi:uncharacterized protein with HEPN domain
MKHKDDIVYLRHAIEAISAINDFIGDMSYEDFSEDSKTISAVVRQLEIVGEATGKISKDFQSKHSEIPFPLIVSMRNKLIHEYFGVRKDVVWDTCKNSLPSLSAILSKILHE